MMSWEIPESEAKIFQAPSGGRLCLKKAANIFIYLFMFVRHIVAVYLQKAMQQHPVTTVKAALFTLQQMCVCSVCTLQKASLNLTVIVWLVQICVSVVFYIYVSLIKDENILERRTEQTDPHVLFICVCLCPCSILTLRLMVCEENTMFQMSLNLFPVNWSRDPLRHFHTAEPPTLLSSIRLSLPFLCMVSAWTSCWSLSEREHEVVCAAVESVHSVPRVTGRLFVSPSSSYILIHLVNEWN